MCQHTFMFKSNLNAISFWGSFGNFEKTWWHQGYHGLDLRSLSLRFLPQSVHSTCGGDVWKMWARLQWKIQWVAASVLVFMKLDLAESQDVTVSTALISFNRLSWVKVAFCLVQSAVSNRTRILPMSVFDIWELWKVFVENVGRWKNSWHCWLRKRIHSTVSAKCWTSKFDRVRKMDFPCIFASLLTSVLFIWEPLPQRSIGKVGNLTHHVPWPSMSFCAHFVFTLCAFLFPLCRSDRWRGPPIQQVWERVKQLHWKSSTGSMLSCSSVVAWSDARFSHDLQYCSRMIPFRQKSQNGHIFSDNNKPN